MPDKERQIAPLAAKGAVFIDGEVGGTPGMVTARKAVVYLAGDEAAARKAETVARGFTDVVHYFGPFGAASTVKLVNNHLVTIHIAAAAEAMALGLKAGVDPELMIKAVAGGSGGSTQFGIRAPWMAQRRFLPAQGDAVGLSHYFDLIGDFADRVGVATPLLDRAVELYQECIGMGLGSHDNAVMVDVIGAMPRRKPGRRATKKHEEPKKKAKPAAKKRNTKAKTKKKKPKTRTARKKTARKSKTRRRKA